MGNEEVSSALLMTAGSMFGIAYILIWGSQLPNENERYADGWNFSSYFLVGNGVAMLFCVLLFKGDYKRLEAEAQFSEYIEDLNEDDLSCIESETWPERQAQPEGRNANAIGYKQHTVSVNQN